MDHCNDHATRNPRCEWCQRAAYDSMMRESDYKQLEARFEESGDPNDHRMMLEAFTLWEEAWRAE